MEVAAMEVSIGENLLGGLPHSRLEVKGDSRRLGELLDDLQDLQQICNQNECFIIIHFT